jgi:glycosyltransferase involved in cell wall biosynthesis
MRRTRVAAVVPAYNEGATLGDVLGVLSSIPSVNEVLVVSDGSTDETVAIARRAGVKTLHLTQNQGKATAMALGVAHTAAELVIFVDADILNLSAAMLEQLIAPVMSGRSAMNIGARSRGAVLDWIYRRCGPKLSGIRCLRREVLEAIPEQFLDGFCIETALNWSCGRLGLPATTVFLHGLKHLVKEKKRGWLAGIGARIRMFAAVLGAFLRLRLTQPTLRRQTAPRTPRPELEVIVY